MWKNFRIVFPTVPADLEFVRILLASLPFVPSHHPTTHCIPYSLSPLQIQLSVEQTLAPRSLQQQRG